MLIRLISEDTYQPRVILVIVAGHQNHVPVLCCLYWWLSLLRPPSVGQRSIVMTCLSVCLSVCKRISATRRLIFTNFLRTSLMSVTRSCSGGVAATLCTSGFVYDVVFAHCGQK